MSKKFREYTKLTGVAAAALVIGITIGAKGSASTIEEPKEEVTMELSVEPQEEEIEVDESVPKEYQSALKTAESYARNVNLSKKGVYEQLISESEQFSSEAADYAISKLEYDWKVNALIQAESYQENLSMSPNAIYEQLVSDSEGFTPEEAQYAIDNLSK